MNVPFVKVNNQQEFDRVVDKMQRETGLPNPHKYDIYYPIISANEYKTNLCGWMSDVDEKIISADEYLTEIRTNFTLSDLEDGMAIEYRKGGIRFVFDGSLLGEVLFGELKDYNKDLSHYNNDRLDIIKVYKINKSSKPFSMLLRELNLTLIFDAETHRNKSKISQRKLEIKNEIEKLEKELKFLEVK